MPNDFDQFDDPVRPAGAPPAPIENDFDQFDNPPQEKPHKFGLMDTWPVRLAKGLYGMVHGAVTLPGDVYAGKVDPLSPEAIGRSMDLATVFNPVEPGVTAGRGALGAIKTPAAAAELPANVQAAQAAVDVGGPGLPRGVASPNPIIRGTTQAARNLPFVGPTITEGVGENIAAAGERVGEISKELKAGAGGRADVGQATRPGLQSAIERNNEAMRAEYNDVRTRIRPEQTEELPNTDNALKTLLKQRAKKANPMAGLEDVATLVKRPTPPQMGPTVLRGMGGLEDTAALPWGANFNELQRVRSGFGGKTKFGEPNPGYDEGERKFIYGAMSKDMENIARQHGGEDAVNALKQANSNAQQYITKNDKLYDLTNKNVTDEKLVGKLINAANAKTGDISLLRDVREALPGTDFEPVAGQLLGELGHNPATNSFSLNNFTKNWNNISPAAKSIMFDPSHAKILDQVANLGKFLKGGEQYASGGGGAAHAVGLIEILEHAAHAATELATGNVKPAAKLGAGLAGGFTIGKLLARPATASSIAKWTRAAEVYRRAPSIRNRVIVNIATRNLINNLADTGIPAEISRRILGPQAQESNSDQPPTNRGPTPQRLRIPIPAPQ
jgi:hypothetical protein